MSGMIVFSKIDETQLFTSGSFDLTMGVLHLRYLKYADAPVLSQEILLSSLRYLNWHWPNKYPDPDLAHGNRVLVTEEYSRSELVEWLRAAMAFLSDARRDKIDPQTGLSRERMRALVARLEIQVGHLGAEIAARAAPALG
jgi:hypothetical protein